MSGSTSSRFFSIYEIMPDLLAMWSDNVQTDVAAKKGLAEVSGK